MILLTVSKNRALIAKLRSLLPALEIHLFDWTSSDPIALIADLQPNLILFDLEDLPPWAAYTRASPATRRIPAVAVGDNLQRAVPLGKIDTFTTFNFLQQLPDVILIRLKTVPSGAVYEDGCTQPLPVLARKGLEEFNAGDYYEAHETLESVWRAEESPIREVYRSILQIAVAYYQISRGNYAGAMKMFLRVVQWLSPLPDTCQGIDLARLRRDAAVARAHLESLGPTHIGEFDRSLLKPVFYKD